MGIISSLFGGNDAPEPPDPYATADAQGKSNAEAARLEALLNRYNQYTPYGNLIWEQGTGSTFDQAGYDAAMKAYEQALSNYTTNPSSGPLSNGINLIQANWNNEDTSGMTAGGNSIMPVAPTREQFTTTNSPDRWSSKIELDPRVQAILDAQLAISGGLANATNSALSRVSDTFGKGIDTTGLPDLRGKELPDWNAILQGYRGDLYDPSAMIDPRVATSNQANSALQQGLARAGRVAGTDFNYDSAPALPTADAATRQQVEDALYSRMESRLAPKFDQARSRMESDLLNRGITLGSDARASAVDEFNRGENDAYQTAINEAIAGGGTEMQRLFGMGMDARQQGVNEANTLRAQPFSEAGYLSGLNTSAGNEASRAIGMDNAYNTTANALTSQAWSDALASRDQTLQERESMLNEQYQARNQILNELSALRTGAQVSQPQFANQATGTNVAAAPVAQSVYNSYQGDLGNYNASVGTSNSLLDGLARIGAGWATSGFKF